MLELKALLLTQGMHGMVSQTEGLAKALNLNFKHQFPKNIIWDPFSGKLLSMEVAIKILGLKLFFIRN